MCDLGGLARRLKGTADFFRRQRQRKPRLGARIDALAAPVDDAVHLLEVAAAALPLNPQLLRIAPRAASELRIMGRQFRMRREALGLTQEQVADAAKVAARTILNLEHGLHRPSAKVLQKLAPVLFPEAAEDAAS